MCIFLKKGLDGEILSKNYKKKHRIFYICVFFKA
jgi:hypothetical protein